MKYQETCVAGRWSEMVKEEQPSEKALDRGVNTLSDLELIGLIHGSCGSDYCVENASSQILEKLDSKTLTPTDLMGISGIGKAKALAVCAGLELGRRRTAQKGHQITSPSDAFPFVQSYGLRDQEHFLVLSLSGAHEVMSTKVVTVGLVNRTLVHPREVFSSVLIERATAVIIAHNHPSGNLTPSLDDLQVTQELKKAGEILGIKVLDHLVFCFTGFYSMLEHGEL
jgi:DNA repair protein RadC